MNDEVTVDASDGSHSKVVCAVFATDPEEPWVSTLVALRRVEPDVEVVVGTPDTSTMRRLAAYDAELRRADNAGQLVNAVHREQPDAHILLITWPTVLPPDPLRPALALADSDLRCASVSFFCNAAGYLSFPHRDRPSIHQIDDLDEQSITRRLRHNVDLHPVSIPYATGPAVLLTAQGLSVIGTFPELAADDREFAVAWYSGDTRSHGMIDYLDPSTFILRPRDLTGVYRNDSKLTAENEVWLDARFPGIVHAPREPRERIAALGETYAAARASVGGLRIVLDGSVLGPKEMGTQVAVLALIKALADRPEIASIGVTLPISDPPPYATEVLRHPKVDARYKPDNDISIFGEVDVIHRPFHSSVDPENWRKTASRIVMTLNDLIAYQIPIYHETQEDWFRYREAIRRSASDVDGLIVISDDVRQQVAVERIGIEDGRLFVVPLGVGHLTGNEPAFPPDELLQRGFGEGPFLVVLGANYAHKNRGRAIEVLQALREMGHPLSLVLAGAYVPYGSSRMDEDAAWQPDQPVYVIPDVSSEERNWLLRHASVVLYPTSAEGFGFVPHEAAAFGTPSVFVPFGPLKERFPDLPGAPRDWSVAELAKATDTLLRDPALAQQQVETIARDTERYDWDNTAEIVANVYRSVLSKPARHKPSV
ncbi:MAG TPA: glycosyltransferase [Mycobacteriales bacterium]